MLFAADLATIVQNTLQDPELLRTTPETMLRHLSRAQQWVALRYRLLRHTYPLPLVANAPFVDLFPLIPRLIVVTHVASDTGVRLYPFSLGRLRLSNPSWIATSGTPQGYYRIGWRYLGLYPVSLTEATYQVTALILPPAFQTLTDVVSVPEAFTPQVAKIASGLLTIGQSRRYQEGLAMLRDALAVTAPATQGGDPRAA